MLGNCFIEIGDNAFGVGVYVGRDQDLLLKCVYY